MHLGSPPNQAQYFPRVIVNHRVVGVHPVIKEQESKRGIDASKSSHSGLDHSPVEELARIWQELLHVDAVSPDQNFFDLGGDSSLGVQMFSRIEEIFGVKLPLATLYDAPTIEELSRILEGKVSAPGWSPLVAIQTTGSRPPFFCVHGAGGTVLIYRDLAHHLGPDQPFYGLQSVGLDGNRLPLTKIEEIAAVYVEEIQKVQPVGPYFLGGYCLGGTIAFEMAQQLSRRGETVALLVLLDTMNWHKVPLNVWTKGSHAIQQWFFHLASFLSLDFDGKKKFFKGKLEVLRNRLPVWRGMVASRVFGASDEQADNSSILSQIWMANDRACWNYLPEPYPGVVTDVRPKKQYRVFSKPGLKWDGLAQGGQEIVVLPVYPASMLVEPFVEHLAPALRGLIDKAAHHLSETRSAESVVSRS